jgi:hypothetical protein
MWILCFQFSLLFYSPQRAVMAKLPTCIPGLLQDFATDFGKSEHLGKNVSHPFFSSCAIGAGQSQARAGGEKL